MPHPNDIPATGEKPQRVLILGASGGLGMALARHYASLGATLCLWGRDHDRLEAIATACRSTAAAVTIRSQDLANLDSALAALAIDDAQAPFDIAILASGLGDIRSAEDRVDSPALVARLLRINLLAPAALASALADRMATRRHGRIVLVGSAASFHALPFAASYASSKAGLARFAQALAIAMQPHGVSITLVSPGFIDTPAAHQVPGPKPFMMSPARAAAAIARAAARGQQHLVMPWQFALLRVVDRLLPAALRDPLLRALAPPGHQPGRRVRPAPDDAGPPA